MIPIVGCPSSIRAMLTVNSSFLLINSLVPSNGSISQYCFHFFLSTHVIPVDSSLNNETIIDKEVINEFLDTIEHPISFFDFETFQNAVPRYDNQRPYMQMPFQYSLHIVNEKGDMSHLEYLGDENIDPRRELSERMLKEIPKTGSIMAYYMPFEKSRIKE